ncbi:MAG: hypothetical protein U0N15_06390 [Bifidobacterium choerinum]
MCRNDSDSNSRSKKTQNLDAVEASAFALMDAQTDWRDGLDLTEKTKRAHWEHLPESVKDRYRRQARTIMDATGGGVITNVIACHDIDDHRPDLNEYGQVDEAVTQCATLADTLAPLADDGDAILDNAYRSIRGSLKAMLLDYYYNCPIKSDYYDDQTGHVHVECVEGQTFDSWREYAEHSLNHRREE